MYSSSCLKSLGRIFFTITCLFYFNASILAQVKVSKSAFSKNPSLHFAGISGNQKLSSLVASDLKNCGWFELANAKGSDFTLSGKSGSGSVMMRLSQGTANPVTFSVKANISNLRGTAHQIVDTILKKLFGISGICNSRIAFCMETKPRIKEIYICDFDGSNLRRITKNNNLCVEPDWTPKNTSLVYTMYSKFYTDVVETDIVRMRSRRLAQFPGLNAGASVSPNGKLLALILSRDRKVELYLKTFGKPGLRRLTKSTSVESSPCWSPRGGKICFVSDLSGRPKLYIINAAKGKSFKRLPTAGSEAVSPDWSKDNKIAYSSRQGRQYTIAIVDLNGGKGSVDSIVRASGDWESPSWAPDNRHLICSRQSRGNSQLYVIDSWTGKAKRLLKVKNSQSLPSWSNLGSSSPVARVSAK